MTSLRTREHAEGVGGGLGTVAVGYGTNMVDWTAKVQMTMKNDPLYFFDTPLLYVMFCWMAGRQVLIEQGQFPFDPPAVEGGEHG